MRRLICIILVTVLLVLSAGCNQTSSPKTDSVLFYYMRNEFVHGSESGVIVPMTVNINNGKKDYRSLLEMYFNGPTNYDCISPFPAGITLEDFEIDSNKVQLVLSPHMALISDSAFAVACACLTRTVIEMTGVKTLQIKIQDNQINGSDSLTFTLDSFTYWDDVELDATH